MQVVDALESLFNLGIVVLDHLNNFLDRLFRLTALKVEAKLPCATLYPELKGSITLTVEESLCLLIGLLC